MVSSYFLFLFRVLFFRVLINCGVRFFISVVLLFCFVLFCIVLFCFVLFCFVLFCFVLFWSSLVAMHVSGYVKRLSIFCQGLKCSYRNAFIGEGKIENKT